MVAETVQGSDADPAVTEQQCIEHVVTADNMPPRNVGWFDSHQKYTGFIDVWWLFDDGGLRLNFVLSSTEVVVAVVVIT